MSEEEKDSAKMAGRNADVEKARTGCMGLWEKLMGLKKTRDQEAVGTAPHQITHLALAHFVTSSSSSFDLQTTKKRADKLKDIDKDILKQKEKCKAKWLEFEQLQKK